MKKRPARRVYDFDWFRVRWLPRYGWVLDRAPAVVVVPIAPDGRVWLAEVSRVPTRSKSWECPGGGVNKRENVLDAGLRELEEECGLIAGNAKVMRTAYELAPGMANFTHHVVIARDVVPKAKRAVGQREEGIGKVQRFSRTGVKRLMASGAINVHATVVALAVSGWL